MASVNQREIGLDTPDFLTALRDAMREDPDVILIGEMRDTETVRAALQAAETGHLVLSTLHTVNATETVNRAIDFFPPYQQQQIRLSLAGSLRGIICQRLVRAVGGSRVPSLEVLVNTGRVADWGKSAFRDFVIRGIVIGFLSAITAAPGRPAGPGRTNRTSRFVCSSSWHSSRPSCYPPARNAEVPHPLPVGDLRHRDFDAHPPRRVEIVVAGCRRNWSIPFEARIGRRVDEEDAVRRVDVPGIEVHVLVPGTAAHPGQMPAEGDLQVPGAVRVEHRPAPVRPPLGARTEEPVPDVHRSAGPKVAPRIRQWGEGRGTRPPPAISKPYVT